MSEEEQDFNAFVSSDNGILKGIRVNKKCNITKNFDNLASLKKTSGYTCLGIGESCTDILVANRVPEVRNFNIKEKSYSSTVGVGEDGTRIVGITRHKGDLVTASQNGKVEIWKKDEKITLNCMDKEVERSGKLADKKAVWNSEEEREKHAETLKIGKRVTRMRALNTAEGTLIAVGGKEFELQVWNLDKPEKPVFMSRNVGHDFLELRIPVWISDIAFLSPTTVAICSRYGHIRKYDITGKSKKERKPVKDLIWKYQDDKVTCTALCAINDHQVIVGSATGKINMFDFSFNVGMKGQLRKYRDCVGAVRDISYANEYFGVVGLDRFLRVYHISDPKPKFNVYLKSKLSGVKLLPDFDPQQEIETVQVKEEAETETLEEILENGENKDVQIMQDDEKQSLAKTRLEQLLSLPSSTYKDDSHPFYTFFCKTKKLRKVLKNTDSDVDRDKAMANIQEAFEQYKASLFGVNVVEGDTKKSNKRKYEKQNKRSKKRKVD